MKNQLYYGWKSFTSIFKDDNIYNEKSIIGFFAFLIMVIIALVDLFTDLKVENFIYDAFVWVTLGSFGIDGVSRAIRPRRRKDPNNDYSEPNVDDYE